jgi:hypothetical protein
MVRVGSKVAAVALAAIVCLAGLQVVWLIDEHREMEAATELRGLGATVLWAWRLDDMLQKKQTVSSQSPRWLTPGDSIVNSVYLTNCGEPRLDDKLVCLERLRNLRYLGLKGTNATDATLVHVTRLPNLEWLDLDNTQVTDSGLRDLATLKRLKYVCLHGTRITCEGIADFRARLPSAAIASDFGAAASTKIQ